MGKGVSWQTGQNTVFLSFFASFFFILICFFLQVVPSLGDGVEKTNMQPTHASYSGLLGACQYSVFNCQLGLTLLTLLLLSLYYISFTLMVFLNLFFVYVFVFISLLLYYSFPYMVKFLCMY